MGGVSSMRYGPVQGAPQCVRVVPGGVTIGVNVPIRGGGAIAVQKGQEM